MATDGNPTGRKNGNQYDPSDWVNTYDSGTGLWTYGPAINDVFTEVDLLRATVKGGKSYDVQTYVIGMGDTVVNPGSVAAFNEMARRGGTTTAYLGSNSAALTAAFQLTASESWFNCQW